MVATELLTGREGLDRAQTRRVEEVVDAQQAPTATDGVHVAAARFQEGISEQLAQLMVTVGGGQRVEVAAENDGVLGGADALTEAIHLSGTLHQVAVKGFGCILGGLNLLPRIAVIKSLCPRGAPLGDAGGLQVIIEKRYRAAGASTSHTKLQLALSG